MQVRGLGFVEQFFQCGNELGGYIMARRVRLIGVLDPRHLQAGFETQQRRLEWLRARIQRRRGTDWFFVDSIADARVDFESCVATDECSWQAVVAQEVHRPFQRGELLWRVRWCISPHRSGGDLVLVFHHSIADGRGVTALIGRVLRAIQVGVDTDPVASGNAGPVVPLSPPIERCLQSPCAIRRIWNMLRQQLRAALAPVRFASLHEGLALSVGQSPPGSFAKQRTRFEYFGMRPETTADLFQRCRDRSVSVHGALCAALLLTARELAIPQEAPLVCVSQIDLRPRSRMEWKADELGCAVFWVETVHRLQSPADFWQLARQCAASVREAAARAGPPPSWCRHFISRGLNGLARNRRAGRTATVGVSNHGRHDLDRAYGAVAVAEMFSATGQQVAGPEVTLIAGTLHDRLLGTLTFVEPFWTNEATARFASAFRHRLERAE